MYEYYDYKSEGVSPDGARQELLSPEEAKKARKKAIKLEKKERRKQTWKKIFVAGAVGITFGILSGASFWCVNRFASYLFPEVPKQAKAVEEQIIEKDAVDIPYNKTVDGIEAPTGNESRRESYSSALDVRDVVKNSMPSIVSITNKSVQQIRSMWGMGVQEYESKSAGSGIIIGKNEEELLIVTNNHVVSGAKTLTVGFVDGEIYEAFVKGSDNDRDLAVVAVKLSSLSDDTISKISIAIMGDSEELEVGEQVVAIGNALGYGQSVTTGIVSALDREVTIEGITNNLIQTDAAINPGNSGGALLNMKGELVGINSAKFAATTIEGVGYAIPVKTVIPIVDVLISRQTRELLDSREAGYLGISGLNVSSEVSKTYGIPEGVYLQEVEDASPAEKAGFIKGDVITKFDGLSVKSITELKERLLYYKAGEEIEIEYYRADDGEYEKKTVKVVLGDRKGTALDPDLDDDDVDTRDSNNSQNGRMAPGRGNDDYSDWGSIFDFGGLFGW